MEKYVNARIINIHVEDINKYLEDNGIAIVPGFQGISKNKEITTIGRGGSDATAVAIAKSLMQSLVKFIPMLTVCFLQPKQNSCSEKN